MSMWSGLAVENLTQFTAAGLLRESIVRIDAEEKDGEIIGHTHDELLLEAPEAKAEEVVKRLVEKMTSGFDWADGLPLAAEPAMSWYYTKNEKASALH
jgi:DNA polymerase I-like protein with 3'-5' exonuclease and polymerase domains